MMAAVFFQAIKEAAADGKIAKPGNFEAGPSRCDKFEGQGTDAGGRTQRGSGYEDGIYSHDSEDMGVSHLKLPPTTRGFPIAHRHRWGQVKNTLSNFSFSPSISGNTRASGIGISGGLPVCSTATTMISLLGSRSTRTTRNQMFMRCGKETPDELHLEAAMFRIALLTCDIPGLTRGMARASSPRYQTLTPIWAAASTT